MAKETAWKKRERLEKAAREAAQEKEQLQKEAQKIQNEKERLLALDEKGLMVELILAMRGLYSQIENIQIQQEILSGKIENIESDICSIQEDISDIERKMENSD